MRRRYIYGRAGPGWEGWKGWEETGGVIWSTNDIALIIQVSSFLANPQRYVGGRPGGGGDIECSVRI